MYSKPRCTHKTDRLKAGKKWTYNQISVDSIRIRYSGLCPVFWEPWRIGYVQLNIFSIALEQSLLFREASLEQPNWARNCVGYLCKAITLQKVIHRDVLVQLVKGCCGHLSILSCFPRDHVDSRDQSTTTTTIGF